MHAQFDDSKPVERGHAVERGRWNGVRFTFCYGESEPDPVIAKLIVAALQKHKVGSGQVPFTLSTANNAVELLLFQVSENHDTDGSLLTGTYTAP